MKDKTLLFLKKFRSLWKEKMLMDVNNEAEDVFKDKTRLYSHELESLKRIIEEAYSETLKKFKLPKNFQFNDNIIFATTDDGIVFMCREDLLDVLGEPEWHLKVL